MRVMLYPPKNYHFPIPNPAMYNNPIVTPTIKPQSGVQYQCHNRLP